MKTTNLFLLLLFISVSLTFGGSIQGVVRDAQSLTPLENVFVTVHVVIPDSIPYPDTTDLSGAYTISEIIPGNQIYAVVAHKNGYASWYARIDNLGSLDLVYDIYLTAESLIPPHGDDSTGVFGAILTPDIGGFLIPVMNAEINFLSGGDTYDVRSDSSGIFSMTIPRGAYSVSVNAEGYNDLTLSGIQATTAGVSVNAVLRVTTVDVPEAQPSTTPERYSLLNAYPNPFNPGTIIRFQIPVKSLVSLKVYNLLGNEIATLVSGVQEPGTKTVRYEATGNTASGVYFYRLQAGNYVETKKFVLLR
jgi:hypothetical protein